MNEAVLRTPLNVRLGPASTGPRLLARLRFQLLASLLLAAGLPALLYLYFDASALLSATAHNTLIGGAVAMLLSLYLYRRVITFPGVGMLGYAMPAVAAGYGVVLAAFFLFRFDYSRLLYLFSFGGALLFIFALSVGLHRAITYHFHVVPGGDLRGLNDIDGIVWTMLEQPALPQQPGIVLIADLRADLGDAWERLIAEAALASIPVYHVKQVKESLTGRVELEHLSENSFGSLIPNMSYRKIKRAIDLVAALLSLPLLVLPALIIAIAIKIDSPGPVFYRQPRRGFRNQVFDMVKFRTMTAESNAPDGCRENAITQSADKRVTRVGRFLRRTRLDELPQIWNIVRGQMSWIGPRPEALALSDWYRGELPFYDYRHIVRPGITGWAQVRQGHVADLDSVTEKLNYDFFYIKNFSAWLDTLIMFRTVTIMLTGFGAK